MKTSNKHLASLFFQRHPDIFSESQIMEIYDQQLLKARALSAAGESALGKSFPLPDVSARGQGDETESIVKLEAFCETVQQELNSACKPHATMSQPRAMSAQSGEPADPNAPSPQSTTPTPAAATPAQVIVVRPNPAGSMTNQQWNPDGKLLAARGVKSQAELNAKIQSGEIQLSAGD